LASQNRAPEIAVNPLDHIEREPHFFDLFSVLRMLERENAHRPRIGENDVLRDELVRMSQDPYFTFPASNLAAFERHGDNWRMTIRFIGQFGPQGALPLAVTEEAYGWLLRQDTAFPRFADIVSNRFLQLFFRAWANSRPIAQQDRPEADRFGVYVGSHIGLGAPSLSNLDSVADSRKRAFAGLLGAKAKSAARLRGFLQGLFGVKVQIDEFVGSHLKLDLADCSQLGKARATLGQDIIVGRAVFSVQDKIRIRVFARDLPQYLDFLPSGRRCDELLDAIDFYLGEETDWDIELALPVKDVLPTRLAIANPEDSTPSANTKHRPASPGIGMLGWTSWMSPNWATSEQYRCDARFHPSDVMRNNTKNKITA
jgi:type VI secretion system protein ImpH